MIRLSESQQHTLKLINGINITNESIHNLPSLKIVIEMNGTCTSFENQA